MINNNKNEFMNAVKIKAEEFKQKSFEAYMCSFLKSIIKGSTVVDVSDQLTLNDKTKIVDMVKGTIDKLSTQIVNGSTLRDETSAAYDVNIAGELENPQSLTEQAAKNIADAVSDETEDRTKVLEAQFETGEFKSADPVEIIEKVDSSFESLKLNKTNDSNLSKKMRFILSVEGEELIESIKSDVLGLINETENKNSIVREAISDINERKDQIEEQVNGDDSNETSNDDKQKTTTNEASSNETNDQNVEQNSSETLKQCRRSFRTSPIVTMNDLVYITSAKYDNSTEGLDVGNEYDRSSFSREEAEKMLNEFREEDDGIDLNNIDSNDNTLSTSEDDTVADTSDIDPSTDNNAESSENDYEDDDGKTIDIDTSKFDYGTDDNPQIEPDSISEEALAKKILPLSLNKLRDNTPVINTNKLALFLACKEDRGTEFFNCINGRVVMITDLLSKEGLTDDNDPINQKLKETIDTTTTVKDKVHDLTEDLGILGILDGKYQRTDDAASNAVKSLANGVLLSKESLEENKYAKILKIALSMGDIVSDISKNVDVSGNREKLGDLEELLNEELLSIDDAGDRADIESKVKALQSIESVCPFEDVVNMQVFVSKSNETPEKISIGSLKDIDAFGYCYLDEINAIENKIKDKFADQMKTQKGDNVVNFDIHQLVEYVAEEKDTTKICTNLYEQVISKLVADKTIESSMEALFIRNKAKAMVTGLIVADKLGYMSKEDVTSLQNSMI